MKKTLITLLALSSVSMGATQLKYWGENNNKDLCTVGVNGLPYLGQGNSRAPESVLDSIKTKDNTDYNLDFTDQKNKASVSFIVNDALYFNQILSSGSVGSYAITFGANGSLTAATKYNDWGGAIRFTEGATVTLTAAVSEEQLNSAIASGKVYERTLISSTDTTSNAMWNVTNNLTVTATGLDGYTYVGYVKDTTTLQKGQYGYTKLLSDDENQGAADGIALVFKAAAPVEPPTPAVPEPTTATLSLLALAGLAARRRRK